MPPLRLRHRRLAALLSLASLAVLAACSPNLDVLRPVPASDQRRVDLCEGACRDSLELTYLGVSGFVLRHGGGGVLTAPSFTHHGLWRMMLPSPFPYRPDTALIDRQMRDVPLDGIATVLVGHAHYDHLLDLPYIARTRLPDAAIYGSRTMVNTLAGDARVVARAVSVADSVGSAAAPGRWIYAEGGGIRFMPLRSSHAPNFWKFTFAPGETRQPRTTLPRTARGWRMGDVYSYLIDVIAADSTPLFRIYYQDAAADSAYVTLPPLPDRDRRGVDVAILCVGNYGSVRGNPSVLLGSIQPRYVVLGHWEDFFRSPLDPVRVIPRTDTEQLVQRLSASVGDQWMTPLPLGRVTFRY